MIIKVERNREKEDETRNRGKIVKEHMLYLVI